MLFLLCLVPLQVADPAYTERTRLAFAIYALSADARPREDLADMGKAGIDVVLVPWPAEASRLGALVEAAEALEARSLDRPRFAPLLPGTADAAEAASFHALVPEKLRVRVDRRPLIWLSEAGSGAGGLDARRLRLREALGADPWLVAEQAWGAGADRAYAAGASWKGPLDAGVASVGPGSQTPLRVREEGAFYEKSWTGVLRMDARWVLVETWNDGGSGVGETPERGRKYVEITRRFLRHFHVGEKVPLPKGKHTGAKRVYYHAIHEPHEQGLVPLKTRDAAFGHFLFRGVQLLSTLEVPGRKRRHLAFDVDDSFAWFDVKSYEVEVEYLDVGEGRFVLEYDSGDRQLEPAARACKSAGAVELGGTGEWKVATLPLPDARFGNQLGDGEDLRIAIEGRGLAVKRVVITPR